jgi:hypothetical protein
MQNHLKLVGVILMIMLFVCLGFHNPNQSAAETQPDSIKPFDNTEKWATPYEAPADKVKKLQEGIQGVKLNMTYREVITKLGTPDTVDDLRKNFFGLSPQEDGMMMRYRNNFSYRAVWYFTKRGRNANLNDKWYALYVGTDEKTVLARMANNIELPKEK